VPVFSGKQIAERSVLKVFILLINEEIYAGENESTGMRFRLLMKKLCGRFHKLDKIKTT